MKKINFALAIYSLIVCFVLLLYLLSRKGKYKQSVQSFIIMCSSNIGMIIANILYWSFEGQKTSWGLIMLWLSNCLFYISVISILYAFTKYIINYLDLDIENSNFLRTVTADLIVLYSISCFLSIWHGMFLTLSKITVLTIFSLNIVFVYKLRRYIHIKDFVFFIISILLLLVTKLIELIVSGLIIFNIAITISLLFLFINIQLEHNIGIAQKEKELTDAKINLLLSQMSPHFLFNTLTAIRQLCDKDVEEAKDTITDFSIFLRGNISILTSKNMISFDKELLHTKYYLAIEKKRFGDKLQIHYDLAITGFFIPPLTLQPIVDNAVRHGITKKVNGGNLYIQTLLQGDWVVIRILDDGIGFLLSLIQNDTDSQSGISNVQKRLAYMCEGILTIRSYIGYGTVVEICIPKEVKNL